MMSTLYASSSMISPNRKEMTDLTVVVATDPYNLTGMFDRRKTKQNHQIEKHHKNNNFISI